MKRFVAILAIFGIVTSAMADCDFSTDVKKNPDGSYTYSRECHIEVGNQIKDNKTKDEQIKKYVQSLELKDLALDKAEQRLQNYSTTIGKMEDRVNTIERMNDTNKLLYLGLGIAATALAVWGAGQLR